MIYPPNFYLNFFNLFIKTPLAYTAKGDTCKVYLPRYLFFGVFNARDIERGKDIADLTALLAKEMRMYRYICIIALLTRRAYLYYHTVLAKRRKIAVDRRKAHIGIYFFDALIYHIGGRVVARRGKDTVYRVPFG